MSLAGVAIAAVSATIIFSFAVADFVATETFGYVGLAYTLAGLGLLTGFAVAGLGVLRSWRQRKRGIAPKPFSLVFDLNQPRQRNIALAVASGGLILLLAVFATSYQTFVYLESNAFCTDSCHSVMSPEGITHVDNPHSRVKCVTCHVGSGAAPFMEAKLKGFNQLIAMVTGDYSRPILTPLHTMRPERVACEQCHWRDRWIGFKEKLLTYYGSSEENPRYEIRMLIKTGGGKSGLIAGGGIHFHVTEGRKVEFVARDTQKQDIAWVRVTNAEGEVNEYNHDSKPLSDGERETLPVHQVDCLDCHNRPAHPFESPMRAINQAMVDQRIDPSIPGIKRVGVKALAQKYDSTEAALTGIEQLVLEHYEEEQAGYLGDNKDKVRAAVAEIQAIFSRTQFPEMRARWSAYPDNRGHREFPGCFRCHNQDMVDATGAAVFSDCTRCHVILTQIENGEETNQIDYEKGQTFYHVMNEETLDEFADCTACHDGADGVH